MLFIYLLAMTAAFVGGLLLSPYVGPQRRYRYLYAKFTGERLAQRNAKVYWDERVPRDCRRCEGGHLLLRRRYVIEKTGIKGRIYKLRELTSLYRCTSCGFQGLGLD